MKCIIFGLNSQDGYYLQKIFRENNIDVIGVSRSSGNWLQGNIANFNFVYELIRTKKPDYIIHIAAKSTTSHNALFENHQTIATGSLNILESVKENCPRCKVFITGSGVQFENKGFPIKETDAFFASSPYSIARIHSVYAARYYRELGIKAYVGYLFHHESALRKEFHVSKMIVNTVKRIQHGSSEKLSIGDTTVMKEWGFAGDIAAGIFKLITQDEIFEATIGTGEAYSIQKWIQLCFEQIKKPWGKYIAIDSSFKKPEYKLLVSDPSTILKLGWRPEVDISSLARLMLKGLI